MLSLFPGPDFPADPGAVPGDGRAGACSAPSPDRPVPGGAGVSAIFISDGAAPGPMATGDTERTIEKEADVESAEYIRTPDGRNVVRTVVRDPEPTDEKR